MIIAFLILIFVELLILGFLGFLAWQKISLFLTWNTRHDSLEYERAITQPKFKHLPKEPSKTMQSGRSITPIDDLVELSDLDFETVVTAIEQVGQ